jgi:hypothetical protein
VGLKLIFIIVTRVVSVLGLSRRGAWLDHFRVRRHDRVGGVIHEYRLVA